MLFRYKGRNFYDQLSPQDLKVFKSYCRAKVFDGLGGNMPFDEYMIKLSDMINNVESEEDKDILLVLKKYAQILEKELKNY